MTRVGYEQLAAETDDRFGGNNQNGHIPRPPRPPTPRSERTVNFSELGLCWESPSPAGVEIDAKLPRGLHPSISMQHSLAWLADGAGGDRWRILEAAILGVNILARNYTKTLLRWLERQMRIKIGAHEYSDDFFWQSQSHRIYSQGGNFRIQTSKSTDAKPSAQPGTFSRRT